MFAYFGNLIIESKALVELQGGDGAKIFFELGDYAIITTRRSANSLPIIAYTKKLGFVSFLKYGLNKISSSHRNILEFIDDDVFPFNRKRFFVNHLLCSRHHIAKIKLVIKR